MQAGVFQFNLGDTILYKPHNLPFSLRCRIINLKLSHGQAYYLLTPLEGHGELWATNTQVHALEMEVA